VTDSGAASARRISITGRATGWAIAAPTRAIANTSPSRFRRNEPKTATIPPMTDKMPIVQGSENANSQTLSRENQEAFNTPAAEVAAVTRWQFDHRAGHGTASLGDLAD
jgi:hypothetical protein